jgi:hypothetical protein
MDFCSTVDRLYRAVPLRWFRDRLIRSHMERCPRCQARLLSRDEAVSLLVGPAAVGPADRLWPGISRRVEPAGAARGTVPESRGWFWRWAAPAAMAAAVALTGFWVLRQVERPGMEAAAGALAERFTLDYVNVGGAPAQTFIYQPQGTDTVFVWASKTP